MENGYSWVLKLITHSRMWRWSTRLLVHSLVQKRCYRNLKLFFPNDPREGLVLPLHVGGIGLKTSVCHLLMLWLPSPWSCVPWFNEPKPSSQTSGIDRYGCCPWRFWSPWVPHKKWFPKTYSVCVVLPLTLFASLAPISEVPSAWLNSLQFRDYFT